MKDYHHLDASTLRFSIFSTKNLKSLSVAKIVTPLVFDQLGHPLPGGLYDQKMGELEQSAVVTVSDRQIDIQKYDVECSMWFQVRTPSAPIRVPPAI